MPAEGTMKRFLGASLFAIALAIPLIALVGAEPQRAELTVYAYDSFVSEWGIGPKVVPFFEKKYNCKVNLVSKGDSGQLLGAAVLERGAPKADVYVGFDNNMAARTLKADVLAPYRGRVIAAKALDPDPSHALVPFDYGYFCLVWDSQKLANPPKSLEDLARPEYARKLILMDPRTSTPGLGFLAWAVARYGEGWADYWSRIKPSILTIASGWDSGYGLFTQGEAPLVLSYTTSPAYHVENDKTQRYKALIFAEGHPAQVELAGIAKGARHPELASAFIDFIQSREFQNEVPLTQWMYPVDPGVKLPASYDYAPKPAKTLSVAAESLDRALAAWPKVASK
jgi:thiamine transport system substrate-binding protein